MVKVNQTPGALGGPVREERFLPNNLMNLPKDHLTKQGFLGARARKKLAKKNTQKDPFKTVKPTARIDTHRKQ